MTRRRGAGRAPPPLRLAGGDLDAARLALATPERRRAHPLAVLACAVAMTAAALALCAVVVLGGWSPGTAAPAAEVRGPLRR